MALDLLIFQFFYQIAERLSFFNFVFVSFAVYLPWFIFLFALWVLLGEKGKQERISNILFTVLAAVVSRGIIAETMRFFIMKERPYEILDIKPLFEAVGSSFPSGHAALLFALAFAMWGVRREWAGWFFVAATINSFARVMSGVHWPSDIVGGFLVALVAYFAVKLLLPDRGKSENLQPML